MSWMTLNLSFGFNIRTTIPIIHYLPLVPTMLMNQHLNHGISRKQSYYMVAQDFSHFANSKQNQKYIKDDIPFINPKPFNVPVILGVAGGSASGKTTLTSAIVEALGEEHVTAINHDNYYKDLRHLTIEQRAMVNFDHPNSLDTPLLIEHLEQLRRGLSVEIPTYDFTTHSRAPVTCLVQPRRIIIVEGILIFSDPELVSLMDMKIFVDLEDDIRLIRRIKRDNIERKRSVESIIEQYTKTVRPMHQLYVEPSKRKADIIVPASNGNGIQTVALEMCVSRLREIINFYQ
eukprot:gene7596-10345_t